MKKNYILIHIEGKDETSSIYFHRIVPYRDAVQAVALLLPNSEVELKELPAGEVRRKRGRPRKISDTKQ